jgi:acetyl-CoA carboxylase alpha subunit
MTDWCSSLLGDVPLAPPTTPDGEHLRNPISWPGYEPRAAVQYGAGRVADHDVVACVWDFATYGGSLGEAEATAVIEAVATAIELRRPLLTVVRTGGTRLQEGVAALVGIARTGIALEELATAGLPHISIADHPTTGGVWVSVVSRADVRAGIADATVGFSGPRVIEAMTGARLLSSANTSESAARAGLLDAVLAPTSVDRWLRGVLAALTPAAQTGVADVPPEAGTSVSGWQQAQRARDAGRMDGAALLDVIIDGGVDLMASDNTVRAVIGRSPAQRPTVGVALAARRGGRPTTTGFRLLARAASLADRVGADLCTLIDTPGADPLPANEDAGLAPAIGDALLTVLQCRTPTVAVVHGEGGSGGALSAAVADRLLITTRGYFTALAPEGAAAALHTTVEEAADRGAITPSQLTQLGFADAVISDEPDQIRGAVAAAFLSLAAQAGEMRMAARRQRWSAPLPGRC